MRFSSCRAQYPARYTNETFAAFARPPRHMMKYVYAVVILCCVMSWFLT